MDVVQAEGAPGAGAGAGEDDDGAGAGDDDAFGDTGALVAGAAVVAAALVLGADAELVASGELPAQPASIRPAMAVMAAVDNIRVRCCSFSLMLPLSPIRLPPSTTVDLPGDQHPRRWGDRLRSS